MAELSDAEQAQLAELQAKENAPEPRTESGVKGVLHALIDVVSGAVPHLSADAWTSLHKQAEGDDQAAAAAEPSGSETEPE